MGLQIDRVRFSDADFHRFKERVREDLVAFEELLARPGFGVGPATLGAELEICLVDESVRPLLRNTEVMEAAADPRLDVELNRFNLECNLEPVPLAGRPFAAMGKQIDEMMVALRRAAATQGGRPVAVGILPTLRPADVQSSVMTDLPRYRALSAGICRLRGSDFMVVIDGDDPLQIACDDVTFEGANTAFQVHLRAEPSEFVRLYNAVQIATAPVLAAAGNSPFFLEHRLWEETRVALFKQAVDERRDISDAWRPARVSFGNGWVRGSPFELFAESAALHSPLLPVVGSEDALACVRAGGVPALEQMRLHHGTVWTWNRAVYDPRGEGHLRIELRALPAGPSTPDMLANVAFLIGLSFGILDDVDWMTTALPFEHAERNFYRAAQLGLDTMMLWPSREPPSPQPLRVTELIRRLLPVARAGLEAAGIDSEEGDRLLGIIAARVDSGQTGARWQRRMLEKLENDHPRSIALTEMFERYVAASESGEPVHRWPLEIG